MLAAVVFAQGCPWRCRYCHNPHLLPTRGGQEHDWPTVRSWLATRTGLLDAVVFSGGEPTLQPGLGAALREVRAMGFATGLHTGGAFPRRLAEVLGDVDWIGFDIKAPLDDYAALTGVRLSGAAAYASLEFALRAGVALEVRTTIHPRTTPPAALRAIACELAARGVRQWVLQAFRPQGCADDDLAQAAPRGASIDPSLVAQLRAVIPEIVLR